MGGKYTNLKVRENLESYDKDPGWYQDPFRRLSKSATKDDLQHDLGFVLSAQDMQKSMNSTHMDHMDIKHGDRFHSSLTNNPDSGWLQSKTYQGACSQAKV
jgi:hypothetical protein